jgi:hypothetical protein
MIMKMFATLEKARPEPEDTRKFNLAAVKHTAVQVTRLLLQQELLMIKHDLPYLAWTDTGLVYCIYE